MPFQFLRDAEVAELVDALDSGSSGEQSLWGFESPLRHQVSLNEGLNSLAPHLSCTMPVTGDWDFISVLLKN